MRNKLNDTNKKHANSISTNDTRYKQETKPMWLIIYL